MTATKSTPAIVADTVKGIFDQTRLGEEFRADVTSAVQKVFDAGAESGAVCLNCPPLEVHEIALFREFVRSAPPAPPAPAATV